MEQNQNKNSGLNKVSNLTQQLHPAQINDGYELILNWYSINSRKLQDEEVLNKLPINTLLKILGHPIWNNIYHCWSIELKHIPKLQAYVQHPFDLNKFTYFIEVYHTNSNGS